jgi:hypothetical protein
MKCELLKSHILIVVTSDVWIVYENIWWPPLRITSLTHIRIIDEFLIRQSVLNTIPRHSYSVVV